MPFGTEGALLFPVNGEVMTREASLLSSLPAPVTAGRAEHLHAEARLIGRQDVRIDVARIDVARVDELATGE